MVLIQDEWKGQSALLASPPVGPFFNVILFPAEICSP